MKSEFLIVLFKDKVKRKIINKFVTSKRAEEYFKKLISDSSDVIFDKKYENGVKCEYEIALLTKNKETEVKYYKDELGRQIKLELEDDDYSISKIEKYKVEELISDYMTKKKISTKQLIKKYLSGEGIKMVSKINNKVVIQNDDTYNLFTLKNNDDCDRFMDCLSKHFIEKKKMDCILVKDISTAQRKYLYDILVEKGFSRSYLFRHSTTHPI